MLKLIQPKKVKLLFGLIYSSEKIYEKTKKSLIKKWGKIDLESNPIEFKYTEYYNDEMGSNLTRRFLSFKNLISPDKIVDIKRNSIEIERRFAIVKKRRINIDPGYLNEAKLILATTKDFSHRIYLKNKIFAEVTLLYKARKFRSLPWTFPDYKTKKYKDIFSEIRNIYKNQIH